MVSMTCMTTKKKFDVENPTVVVLANGRYAFRCTCPWEGKNGKKLVAFKFCSAEDHREYEKREHTSESEHTPETLEAESKHISESDTDEP